MSKMSEKIKMPPKKLYGRDDFQTPKYGVEPLLKYIPKDWIIWECAEGIGIIPCAGCVPRKRENNVEVETSLGGEVMYEIIL